MDQSKDLPVLRLGTKCLAIHCSQGVHVTTNDPILAGHNPTITLTPAGPVGMVMVMDDDPERLGYRQIAGYVLIRPAALELSTPADVAVRTVVETLGSMVVVQAFSPPWTVIESATRQHAQHG
jgi:hypothetical protein